MPSVWTTAVTDGMRLRRAASSKADPRIHSTWTRGISAASCHVAFAQPNHTFSAQAGFVRLGYEGSPFRLRLMTAHPRSTKALQIDEPSPKHQLDDLQAKCTQTSLTCPESQIRQRRVHAESPWVKLRKPRWAKAPVTDLTLQLASAVLVRLCENVVHGHLVHLAGESARDFWPFTLPGLCELAELLSKSSSYRTVRTQWIYHLHISTSAVF